MRNIVQREFSYGGGGLTGNIWWVWTVIRNPVVVPLLWFLAGVCSVMSIMLFLERVYMAIVILFVKLLGKKRYTTYNLDRLKEELEENNSHPMVLVQVPMFNEKEVFRMSIGAACSLNWPANKLIIQVLDDSTEPLVRELVDYECQSWRRKGVNIVYETRPNRNGYKAGALRQGLKKSYVKACEYVVIFDADFQPEPDFLWRTIPFLLSNSKLALAQARWKFINADECLLTRLQEMSLDYHFSVEQEVGSSTYSFFGFNGTAGVWRTEAIEDAGGWNHRTTVEDMDLAVRASLKGWKFVFVGDLSVKNELPSTLKAYRYQQHRWSCGPANLFRKMFREIIVCKRVSAWKKFHVIYAFFFVRKIAAHFVTFFFYCFVIPLCVLIPDVRLHKFLSVYIPSIITILNALSTPRSFHLIIFWILFENVMAMHRAKATIIGLLEANRANEWVVTEKLGNALKYKNSIRPFKRFRCQLTEKLHKLELFMSLFLLYCAIYDIMFGHDHFYIYLIVQSAAFFVVGIGYVGIYVPPS